MWLWDDWPDRDGPDCGIDLVAETHGGELWAVQAKAVSVEHAVRKDEIDSFLSASSQERFSKRLLIATTDQIGRNAKRVLRTQDRPVEVVLRSALGRCGAAWPSSPADLRPAPVRSLGLRRHQKDALDAVQEALADNGRAQVVMACGTGKTLVAVRARERLGARRTVIALPSLPLMKQTIATWQAQAKRPFQHLAICSDSTVESRREDEVQVDPSDLGVRVTTDPSVVRQFLDSDEDIVVFTTYHSSPIVAAACSDDRPFDLVICDEAHWCAGDLDAAYATPLREDDIPAARRLFLTATPRIFSEEQKTQAADRGHRLASMDDDELFGPVVHHLPFGRAIELGLLADYRVVVCVVDDNERMRLVRDRRLVTTGDGHITDASLLATHVLVARAMRRFDLTRTLTFHGRIARAAEFSERLPKVVEWMAEDEAPIGRLTARHVHGQMPTQTREAILGALRELPPGERAMVSNVRCLAEGVDVPAIDSVAIIDPKRSRNEIIQAVGRALRAHGDDSKVATVIVPAFVAKGQSVNSALTDEAFQPVWDVLAALREQDERLADEIDALRFELGPRTSIDRRPARIELQVAEEVGVEFVEAFNARLAREIGTTTQTQIRTGQIRLRPPEDEDEVVYARSSREREEVNVSLIPVGLEALHHFVWRTGHAQVPAGHRESGFGLGDWLRLILHALDREFGGDLNSIFPEEQAEKFARLVRAVDLPFGEYPNLQPHVDLLDSLPRFRDAVERGRVPAEFADIGTVRVSSFPASVPADTTSIGGLRRWWESDNGDWRLHDGIYHQVISQLDPKTHAEHYEAALIALGTLGYLDDQTRQRPSNEHGPFQAGFADGLAELSLEGCLIDRVAARYRQNYTRVWIYVAGWELGKKARRSSFAFNAHVAA